jgi:hypothetical protein
MGSKIKGYILFPIRIKIYFIKKLTHCLEVMSMHSFTRSASGQLISLDFLATALVIKWRGQLRERAANKSVFLS